MEIFLISKEPDSNIMDFQLQQIHSCESVGQGVCITKMRRSRIAVNPV